MKKKMNEKWLPHIIAAGAFAVFIMLGVASAATMGEATQNENVESFKSAEELKEHLGSQPSNSPYTPIKVTVTVTDQTLMNIVDVIKSDDKYVNLNFSGYGLTSIRENAFKDCKYIAVLNIPSSVNKIDLTAFLGLDNLTAINVSSGNKNFSSENGILYNKDKTMLIKFPSGKTGSFEIIPQTYYIATYAFYGSNLTSITLYGGYVNRNFEPCQQIMKNAFINCNKLTSITIKRGGPYFHGENFDGNFMEAYSRAGFMSDDKIGTYIRETGSNIWKKQ